MIVTKIFHNRNSNTNYFPTNSTKATKNYDYFFKLNVWDVASKKSMYELIDFFSAKNDGGKPRNR